MISIIFPASTFLVLDENRFLESIISSIDIMAKIKVEITVPASVTAIISKEAVEDLGIKVGGQVEAMIKATEVMMAK